MGDTTLIVPCLKLIIRTKIGWLSFIFNYDAVIEHTVISGLHPKILGGLSNSKVLNLES